MFPDTKGDEEFFCECASHHETSRRGKSANVGSKFPKRSPLFTSVLFEERGLMAT
jgi:hypothetical protein